MKKKKLTKQQKEEIKQKEKIKAELCASIEFISNNEADLKTLNSWELFPLQSALNGAGYSLVATGNLADFYKVQEFCESNAIELINIAYGF